MSQASGQVIQRPTGELALLWELYADLLDKQLRASEARREARKQAQSRKK